MESYYSKPLCTPDGIRRKYYCSYPAGFDVSDVEPPEIVEHLEALDELELDLFQFNSQAVTCLICKFQNYF